MNIRLNAIPFYTAGVAVALVVVGAAAAATSRGPADHDRLAVALETAQAVPSSAQAAAAADRLVTRAEMDQAVANAASCMVAKGHAAEARAGSGRDPASITFTSATLGAAEAAHADLQACQEEHSLALLQVWIEQNRPTASEAAEARAFVARCAAERGGRVATLEPTDMDISRWMDSPDPATRIAIGQCVQERYRVYGF